MKGFKRILDEVRRNLDAIEFLDILLSTVLIFLASYLMLMLISVNPLYAAVPALTFMAAAGYIALNRNKLQIVEGEYAELDEKLRTAQDYLDKDNEMVEALQEEIARDIRKVEAGRFFDPKRSGTKIIGIVLLCFLIIFASTLNIQLFDFSKSVTGGLQAAEDVFFKDTYDTEADEQFMQGGKQESEPGDVPTSDDIYGSASIAKLGGRATEVEIRPVNYEISIRDGGEVQEKQFEELFPEEIYSVTSETYEENIPKEQEDLVRSYFENLAGR
ncbi:hypothetical protein GF351_05080 [Candidatus Woesearchaeota archaeon]|nr:hypothetical protein [Candidatus Woesearchaeota archaeon]